MFKNILLIVFVMSLSACDTRFREGEDLTYMPVDGSATFVATFVDRIKYIKDKKGICYAILNNIAHGLRNTFTFTSVDCASAGL